MEENSKPWIKIPTQTIHLEANPSDIRKYVFYKLSKDENYSDMDDDFREEIMDKIIATADGMFVFFKRPYLGYFSKLIHLSIIQVFATCSPDSNSS
jgi:hypothetical protein